MTRSVNSRIASIEARTSFIASRPTSGTMIGGCGAMPAKTREPMLIFHQPAFRARVNAKKRNNATPPAKERQAATFLKFSGGTETHFIIENGQGYKTQVGYMADKASMMTGETRIVPDETQVMTNEGRIATSQAGVVTGAASVAAGEGSLASKQAGILENQTSWSEWKLPCGQSRPDFPQ